MILRIASTLVMAVAALYAAEGFGLIPAHKYFPSLPRLEASQNTVGNWMEAAHWGLSTLTCLTQGTSLSICTGSTPNNALGTTQSPTHAGDSFTARVSHS